MSGNQALSRIYCICKLFGSIDDDDTIFGHELYATEEFIESSDIVSDTLC